MALTFFIVQSKLEKSWMLLWSVKIIFGVIVMTIIAVVEHLAGDKSSTQRYLIIGIGKVNVKEQLVCRLVCDFKVHM